MLVINSLAFLFYAGYKVVFALLCSCMSVPMSQQNVSFGNIPISKPFANRFDSFHVFLDYCSGRDGHWSSEGVTTKILDNGVVQCNSTHLTSFTVIVAINDIEVCTQALGVMYKMRVTSVVSLLSVQILRIRHVGLTVLHGLSLREEWASSKS